MLRFFLTSEKFLVDRTSEKIIIFLEVLFGLLIFLFSGINALVSPLENFSELKLAGIRENRGDHFERARSAKYSKFFRQVKAFLLRLHWQVIWHSDNSYQATTHIRRQLISISKSDNSYQAITHIN